MHIINNQFERNRVGAASTGGASNVGTIFELSPASRSDGPAHVQWPRRSKPPGRLLLDAHGNLYDTTYQGGAFSAGLVFILVP